MTRRTKSARNLITAVVVEMVTDMTRKKRANKSAATNIDLWSSISILSV
jgi:hypothetical protein